MRTDRIRIEVLRFALLVTLTVALVSVAVRADDHGDRRATARPPATSAPGGANSGSTNGDRSAAGDGGANGTSPRQSDSGATPPGTSAGEASGHGAVAGTGGQPAPGSVDGVTATLPRTGDDHVVRLTALALLLLLAGTWCVRLSRRPQG